MEVSQHWQRVSNWSSPDDYGAYVEGRLASFNLSLPAQAMEQYKDDDNFASFAAMLTDIAAICPMQVGEGGHIIIQPV